MAINKNGHLRGKVGNTINYQLNGQDVVKIRAAHVFNPNTPGQVAQRIRIKTSSRFVKSVHNFIKIGYQATSLDYPANEARQFMLRNCFTNGEHGPVLDYEKVMISRGLLKKPEDITFTIVDKSVVINWKKPSPSEHNGDEKVMITMYWEEGKADKPEGMSQLINNGIRRRDGSISIPIPSHSSPLNSWLFFYDPEASVGESRKKISDSVWLGCCL